MSLNLFVILCLAIVSSIMIQKISVVFIWIFLLWGFACIYLFLTEKNNFIRLLCCNLAILFLSFGAIETYCYFKNNKVKHIFSPMENFTNRDWGYALVKNSTTNHLAKYRGNLVFDVNYTINSEGLRIIPPKAVNCDNAVLFFGCSFTFGHGLEDDQAIPYIVGQRTNESIYNFSYLAYGAHHMLRMIEQGFVKKSIQSCRPRYAVYQAMLHHVIRSTGHFWYDKNGPQYEFDAQGVLKYKGKFNQSFWKELFFKSEIYRRFFLNSYKISQSDIQRFIGIVNASRNELIAMYPGIDFHIIFIDYMMDRMKENQVIDSFKSLGIKVHLISDILPGYKNNQKFFQISPEDSHWNALATELIAEYVAKNIVSNDK